MREEKREGMRPTSKAMEGREKREEEGRRKGEGTVSSQT